jgi:hypothetical protein
MIAADWRTWVLQTTTGVGVYDLDSIAAPRLVKDYLIAGPARGGAGSAATCAGTCAGSFDAGPFDYDQGAVWFTALTAPYLYVAQAGNGLNIFRFKDPGNPASLAWVRRYDTSWFGHRVNQIWVRGNFAVAAAVNSAYGVTLLDLSNPERPAKLQSYGLRSSPPIRNAYAWTLNGSSLYAATKPQGGGQLTGLAVYGIDPITSALTTKAEVEGGCSTAGYAAIQDSYALVGLSTCFQKITLPQLTRLAPQQPPYWDVGVVGADNDFVTPFGNLFFGGNDRHTRPGSMVLCHQAAKDTKGPAVNGRNPRDGATGVRSTSGIGLSFTDNLAPWTISSATLPIRIKGTGTAIAGYYSYQLNTVNFRPAAPLLKGTTYEVVVTRGVKDLASNGAAASIASFTTGSS